MHVSPPIKLTSHAPAIASSFRCPSPHPNSRSVSVARAVSSSESMEAHGDSRRRITVCGGGVIGVCTAYYLAKKGAAVTLIEKSSIACAASGKAGGFLALDWCDGGALSDLARASFELHRSLAQELDGARTYGYRPLDTLSVVINEKKPRSGESELPAWVDGPAQNARIIGTTSTTAQVHPQLFTRKMLETAVANFGVRVEIGKVERVGVEDGRVRSVFLDRNRVVYCDDVVLALGPWSSGFPLLSSLFAISGLKAHSLVLEPNEPTAISGHALFLTYYGHGQQPIDPELYPRPTGEVYVCGMSAEGEVPDDPVEVTPDPVAIQVLRRVAGTVSTRLREGNARLKAERACFLPCTDDGFPVIGEVPRVRRCYVATGHSCWGILNGPATGASLAELVIDGQSRIVNLQKFSPARFGPSLGHGMSMNV